MSALAPLMGRLSQVFSARICMFFSTMLLCVGSLVTSLASSLRWFLIGRSVTGSGAAGILIVATIIIVQMVSAKRRGLFIGLANTGITVGISLGAVIAGGLEPRIGWVSMIGINTTIEVLLILTETTIWYPSSSELSCGYCYIVRPPFRIQSKA